MGSLGEGFQGVGKGIDWLIRGQFIVQLLGAIGAGKVLSWLLTRYLVLPRSLDLGIWFLASAGVLWLLLAIFGKKPRVQSNPAQAAIQAVDQKGLTDVVKAVETFYNTNSGPMLQEVEAHAQQLTGYHKNPAERERFFVRTVAAAIVSYIFDVTWLSIYRSQLELMHEINIRKTLTVTDAKHFYDAAAQKYPQVYQRYPFESWLSFLRNQVLIKQDGATMQLTVRGIDFLKYLVQCGLSEKLRQY